MEPVPRPGETAAPIGGRKLPEEEGGVAVTGAGAPVALGRGPAGRCEGLEGGEENLGSGGWAGAERDTGLF